MTLAFLDISIWIKLVIIAHIVVSALLILVILMQRPKQEGLGAAFGSGMTDAAWGARTTDVLQRGTVYLGTLFFVFSLVLSILVGKKNSAESQRADAQGAGSEEKTEEVIPEVEEEVPPAPVDEAADFEKELEGATPPETPAEALEGAVIGAAAGAVIGEQVPAEPDEPETPAGQ